MAAEPELYNSRIVNNFVEYIVEKKLPIDIDELLRAADMHSYEVKDEGHWFTQRQINLFHEKMHEMVGRDISREAGRFAASGKSLGLAANYLLGMIGPSFVFNAISRTSRNITRSSVYSSKKLADNKVEVTVKQCEGVQEKEFQCENRMGFFEAALMMFDYNLPEIEHPECMFRGGDCCRYIVTWEKTLFARLKSSRNILIPVLLLSFTVLAISTTVKLAAAAVSGPAVLLLVLAVFTERLEKRELTSALVNLKETAHNLVEQVETNYNNAHLVNEVGQAISNQSDIDEALDNVIRAIENRLSYDRCMILLADQQKLKLVFRTGFGYSDHQLSLLKNTSFNLAAPDMKGVFVTAYREQRPMLVNDFNKVSRGHADNAVFFGQDMQAQSFICCPIICEGVSLGVLAVDNIKSKRRLVQSDLSLLMGIAPVIGMSLRNAMYIERERRMAEQLRHSQKMEAVGQLAGGIAHDFNNLLTAIIGFTNLAQMNLGPEDPSQGLLEQVEFAAERAAHLTQGLLAFSRKQINDPRPVDLNIIVENIKKLLKRLISEEIELDVRLERQRLQIHADSGQIEQVLMNLVTNARDAISGSGVVTISTCEVAVSSEFASEHGFGAPGRYALLSVADSGSGMDEATLAHVFEPFFTTKEVGKGTGLGMAIVYGIVQQHNGVLDVQSQPGVGTIFHVYLPLLQEEVDTPPEIEKAQESCRGTETVLVADDAREVRKLTAEVLKQKGYRVIEAVDGKDAIEKFKEHDGKVDLVIMDVVMPRMNGRDAFSEIAKMNPRLKVLFTSGYTPEDASRRGVTFAGESFLAKPSTPQVLLRKVREALKG